MIRRLAPAIFGCLLASACVWPVPQPGDPVPTIEASSSWSAASGTLTLQVTTRT